jgi:NADPH:quinone reductase-like Zn-dependent oxidoreductase
MQAVRIHRFGGPEVMAIDEIDQPTPAANEVVIKVFAASVNPVDAKMREGKYPVVTEKDLPYVLGRDVSGEIAAVGSGVASFLIGDKVFAFLSPEHGGYEEFVVASAEEVALQPQALDAIGSAAVPLAGSQHGRGCSITVAFWRASVSLFMAVRAASAISPFSSPRQRAHG